MTRKTVAINVGRGGNDAAGRPGPPQAPAGTLPSSATCGQTNPCRSQTCPKTGLHAAATRARPVSRIRIAPAGD